MSTPPALIAVDIDGTLLASSGTILPGTRAEFARARQAGATIVLASGRPVAGLRRLVRRLRLETDGLVLCGVNGSVSEDAATGRVLARHPMSIDVVRRIVALAHEHDVTVMLCDGDDLVVEDADEPQVQFEAQGNELTLRAVEGLADLTGDDVTVDKVLTHADPAVLRPFAQHFAEEFTGEVEFSFSAPFYFEATARGVDKGAALADLAEARGWAVTDSVAFGDNGNDLPMLRIAGLGVAMGNAIPEVREAADRITASHDEEGIAAVLKDLYGDGEPAPPVAEPEVEHLAAVDLTDRNP